MIPHTPRAFEIKASTPGWTEPRLNGRAAYIRTLDDHCNPLALQNQWYQTSGVEWETVAMNASHCPSIIVPELVTKFTADLMKK
jgi:hypothetical protein